MFFENTHGRYSIQSILTWTGSTDNYNQQPHVGSNIGSETWLKNSKTNNIYDYTCELFGRQKPVYRLCANFPMAPEVGIPSARYVNARARSRYTDGTVYQRQPPEVGIQTLFSNAYWHRNARVIEIHTRQQLKNNFFYETQRIFMNKFCIWTPSGQRTS